MNFLKNFAKFVPYIKSYYLQFLVGMLGLLMSTGSVVCFGKVIGSYVDANLDFELSQIKLISILLLCFILGSFIRSYIFNFYSRRVVWDIAKDAHRNILFSSQELFDELGGAKIASELSSSISFLIASFGNCISFVVRYGISIFAGVIMMFVSSAQLAAFALLVIPVVIVVLMPIRKKSKKLNKSLEVLIDKVKFYASESIFGVKNIQSYCKEQIVSERFSNMIEVMLKEDKKRLFLKSLSILIIFIVLIACIIGFITIGKFYIRSGSVTIGDVAAFTFYSVLAVISAIGILEVFSNASGIFECAETIISFAQIKSKEIEITNTKNFIDKNKIKNSTISFKDFSLSLNNRKILKKINLPFEPRTKIAIVGPSGSGKSSICNALLRFYDPSSGLIDFSCDIKSFDLYEFRKLFGFVGHESFIFEGSFASNISYGESDVVTDEILLAADLADAKNFIMSFKNGFEEKIAYGAKNISEGQRQRIMIARCLFFKRQVIVFDEATSALDYVTEKKILDNVLKKCSWDFFITVTHRISVIKDFDLIVVMNDGEVESIGTHNNLMKKSSVYRDLVNSGQYENIDA